MRRRWGSVLVLLCACSSDPPAVVLAIDDVPDRAATFDIILAGTDSGQTLAVTGQRGTQDSAGTVDYYKQVDSFLGFPASYTSIGLYNQDGVADVTYTPFVIARDHQNDIVGIGIVGAGGDDAGTPGAVQIVPRANRRYPITFEATYRGVAQDLRAGDVVDVPCDDGAALMYESGFAWQPLAGGDQVRLLFPALASPAGASADARAFDLDCDGSVAGPAGSNSAGPAVDCDDLDFHVYPTAFVTSCSEPSQNCASTVVGQLSGCTPPTGLPVCIDVMDAPSGIGSCSATGPATGPTGQCLPNPICGCLGASATSECANCILQSETTMYGSNSVPCQPATATVTIPTCTACTVALLGVSPPTWTAQVTMVGGSAIRLTVSTTAAAVATTQTAVDPSPRIAQVYLQYTQAGLPGPRNFVVGIDINADPSSGLASCPAVPSMQCD